MKYKSTLARGLSHAWPWTKPIGSSPTASRLLRYSLLCMLVLLCGGSAWAQDKITQYTFEKVTSNEGLVVGEKYIIVCESENVAMGAAISNNKSRDKVAISIKNSTIISESTDIAQFTLGGETNAYTLSDGAQSFLALTKASNEIHVATSATGNDAKWKIDVTKSTPIESVGQSGRYIKYNNNNSIFRCYASGQKDIVLYKLTKTEQVTPKKATTITLSEGYTTSGMEGTTIDLPTATVMAGETAVTGATVNWSSSDEEIATIGDGVINLLKPGNVTITASFEEDDNYLESENGFELTVTESPEIANPYTYTFEAKVFDAKEQTEKLSKVNWALKTDGNYFGYDGTKGQQFGSGSAPAKTLTLSTSDIPGTITSITIKTNGASNIAATIGITVGGTAFKCDNETTAGLTSTATEYTFTGSASGDIIISYNQTSSKAIYIKSIVINYSESSTPVTPDPLYILGVEDLNEDNNTWSLPADMKEMTWDAENKVYTYKLNNTSTASFCFSTNNEVSDWDTFNSTYRWAIDEGDSDFPQHLVGMPLTLLKVNGTIKLPAGTWTISIATNDTSGEMGMTITGEATPVEEHTYIVAGSKPEIFGMSWDGTYEANKMTKQNDGSYQKTYTVDQAYEDVQLKVVKDGSDWIGDNGYNVSFNLTGAGNFTVTINPETNVVSVTGNIVQFPTTFEYEKVFAVGNGEDAWLNGANWDPGYQDNQMTEVSDGVWEISFENVPAGSARNIKFAIDGAWTHNFGGTFSEFGVATDAVYNGGNIEFNTENDLQNIKVQLDLSNFDFNTKEGAKFTISLEAAEEPGFRDIKLDLTQHPELLTGDDVLITVAEDGTIGTTDNEEEAAAAVCGHAHSSYGSSNFTAIVPVEGTVKITYATHDYGNDITVTNDAGAEVAKFNTMGDKWMNNHNNVVVAYYRTNEPTTLHFSNANFNPYFAVEAIDPADIPAEVTKYTVTFAAGDGVLGVAPAAIEVEAGSETTAPRNTSLYKEGYTLIGWESGNEVILPGAKFTPKADMELTAKFGVNEVSLADREEDVTITYVLDGYNDAPKYNFQSGDGIIVTQATVNEKTIDVAVNTNGMFANNNSGWTLVNKDTKVTVPSCKGATIKVTTYQNANALNFGETAAEPNANPATYTATAEDETLVITQTAQGYWSKLEITLPKVESTEPGGDDVSGVFFSADVIATEVQNFATGTTEITSAQATIVGGKMYAISAQETEKALINKQNNIYYFSMTNNNTYFKVELDHALAVGDVITADANGGVKNNLNKGLWVSTSDSYPSAAPACAGTSERESIITNLLNYTIQEGDEYVGKKTLYIYRAAGATEYFGNLKITRPADEPVAEDVTAMWDFEHNCANLASKSDGGSYTEETMASSVEGISMTIAYNGGQIKNNDNSYQVTNGVVMQIPVKNAGDEVTVVGFPGYYSYSIGGTDATEQTTTHKATADEAAQGYVAVVSTSNNNYINSIAVTQYAPKPVGLKEKAIIDTDFQDWAKSSETSMVTTKYTKENITFTYSNATVDPEATNENKFPTTTDAAYKGYIMSAKSEATITTTTFASISKIRYRHGATGNNRGWGLKMKVGDGEWEIVSDATVGSTPAWIEKTIDKENVQLQWYNLNATQNAYMFELEVYAKVDLSNSPLLATLKANGTTYTAEDIFEMGTDDNYAATIELASTEAMPSAENPVEAVADNGEIGDITYETSNDQSVVTIPVTAGEASVNYVATFVRKPNFTLTYYNVSGEEIGTQTVEKDAKIGEFAYNIADVQAKTDGYKARGWFKNNYVGEKWTTESVITADAKLYAVETEIEVSSDSKRYEFDLTDKNFDADDHEAFNPTGNGKWHDNQHGWAFADGDKLELLVGGKASIILGLCQYSADVKISASNDESVDAKVATDGATATIEYEGEPGTLTLNFKGTTYLHKLTIFNTTTTNYEVNGDWIIVKEGDGSSLVDALFAAKEGTKIFLPNGTYDLGQKTLTTIGKNNVSIIGESMEGVIIKNRPTTEGIAVTATLLNTSTGLYMQDLTLQNDWDYYNGGADGRAVCIQDKGTQTICKNVTLLSYQDTYYTNNTNGEYYWETSDIHGTVDFICGEGTLFMEESTLTVEKRKADGSGECTITAPSTAAGKEVGYVFNNCKIENSAASFNLGRAWNNEPRCAFINPTYNDARLIANRWTLKGMNVVAKEFVEYNPSDGKTENNVTFTYGTNSNTMNTIISDADKFSIDKVFTGWAPNEIATQIEAPVAELKNGVITWEKVDGATAYALFNNGSLMAIVDGETTSYTVENGDSGQGAPALRRAEDNTTPYTLRAANGRGGFGEPKIISMATGIKGINAELNGDVKIYDMQGRQVKTATKGVYIINGKKVVIK